MYNFCKCICCTFIPPSLRNDRAAFSWIQICWLKFIEFTRETSLRRLFLCDTMHCHAGCSHCRTVHCGYKGMHMCGTQTMIDLFIHDWLVLRGPKCAKKTLPTPSHQQQQQPGLCTQSKVWSVNPCCWCQILDVRIQMLLGFHGVMIRLWIQWFQFKSQWNLPKNQF